MKPATEKDISLIQELARKSWKNAYSEILSKAQIDFMLETMYSAKMLNLHICENPNYRYFLISDNGNFVGFVGFEHHYENLTTKLHRIYLLTEAKGKGLGKMSIDFLKNETRKSGDKRIILTVNKNNPVKNFYEKLGFQIYGEAIFDIGNGFVMDDFLMEFLSA
ncbi:MAG: GNAT family N-acetyltransferase [Flavobacteriaceae bacterium]|jgi:ribosomal protein S18 acetylase RimI-like enzyme|nr:GNAT family N-acetyltransferase [Flavobacteriaceae bacterium]